MRLCVFCVCSRPRLTPTLQVRRSNGAAVAQEQRKSSSSWKWFGIPWSLGVLCLAALQLVRTVRREQRLAREGEPVTWQLSMFRLLPARTLSRAWGSLATSELPPWLRTPTLGLYVRLFGVQLDEAMMEDLQCYQSLKELFTRKLKHGVRPISHHHQLVSPSDGKVLHFGKVDSDKRLEQVKGVTYHLDHFLGAELHAVTNEVVVKASCHGDNGNRHEDNGDHKGTSGQGCLYHVILYLAPGDYHHFHSPVDWTVHLRRHFPGELLTVAPWAAKTMPGLFVLNERVVLSGHWQHGLFSFTAVGAYNVGSINMAVDKSLQTNVKGKYKIGEFFEQPLGNGVNMKKGDRVGHFNLGSSIVLIFEAPQDFEFQVEAGQVVKYGQPLGTCGESATV